MNKYIVKLAEQVSRRDLSDRGRGIAPGHATVMLGGAALGHLVGDEVGYSVGKSVLHPRVMSHYKKVHDSIVDSRTALREQYKSNPSDHLDNLISDKTAQMDNLEGRAKRQLRRSVHMPRKVGGIIGGALGLGATYGVLKGVKRHEEQ